MAALGWLLNLGFAGGQDDAAEVDYTGLHWTLPDRLMDWTAPNRLMDWTLPDRSEDA